MEKKFEVKRENFSVQVCINDQGQFEITQFYPVDKGGLLLSGNLDINNMPDIPEVETFGPIKGDLADVWMYLPCDCFKNQLILRHDAADFKKIIVDNQVLGIAVFPKNGNPYAISINDFAQLSNSLY